MPRYAVLLLALLLGATLMALDGIGVSATSRSQQDFPPNTSQGTPVLVVSIPTTSPSNNNQAPSHPSTSRAPSLSGAQRQQSIRLAEQDGYVKRLLQRRVYEAKSVSTWLDRRRSLEGGIVSLAFRSPVRLSGTWLRLMRKPYQATYTNIRSLKVWVDLRRGQVEAIAPATR